MICILDTETGGSPALPSNPRARVVELGAVILDPHDDYFRYDGFESLLRPDNFDPALDAAGLVRSGISVSEVLEAMPEQRVRATFHSWLAENNVTEVFSYNRVFDETMLKRSGFVLPWTGCIMRMARAAMPERRKDPSLMEAAEALLREIPVGAPHRALPDARLAALVFAAIRRRSFPGGF